MIMGLLEIKAVLAQVVSCCVYDKSKRNKQNLHGTIQYMFDRWLIQFFISFY